MQKELSVRTTHISGRLLKRYFDPASPGEGKRIRFAALFPSHGVDMKVSTGGMFNSTRPCQPGLGSQIFSVSGFHGCARLFCHSRLNTCGKNWMSCQCLVLDYGPYDGPRIEGRGFICAPQHRSRNKCLWLQATVFEVSERHERK